MYRIIVTTDYKDGRTLKMPFDFTDLDKALAFIKDVHMEKFYDDFFRKYELFQLRKDVKHL